jgi:hypothetical protein
MSLALVFSAGEGGCDVDKFWEPLNAFLTAPPRSATWPFNFIELAVDGAGEEEFEDEVSFEFSPEQVAEIAAMLQQVSATDTATHDELPYFEELLETFVEAAERGDTVSVSGY